MSCVLISTGLWLFDHGRDLPTAEEDAKRDRSFFEEFLDGPPGFARVKALVGGVVLVIMGVFGIGYAFVSFFR